MLVAFIAFGGILWPADLNMKTLRITLDEVASYKTALEVVKVADARKIPYARQSKEDLASVGDPGAAECKRLGAIGRLLLSFPSLNNDVTIYVSFFVDNEDRILGSSIIVENINLP